MRVCAGELGNKQTGTVYHYAIKSGRITMTILKYSDGTTCETNELRASDHFVLDWVGFDDHQYVITAIDDDTVSVMPHPMAREIMDALFGNGGMNLGLYRAMRVHAKWLAKMVQERDEKLAPLLVEKRDTLRQLMSDISEDCWCAGWLIGTEFALWQFVLDGPGDWGQDSVSQAQIDELKRLSELVGGWFYWDDDPDHFDATFIPMAEWLVMHNAWTVK